MFAFLRACQCNLLPSPPFSSLLIGTHGDGDDVWIHHIVEYSELNITYHAATLSNLSTSPNKTWTVHIDCLQNPDFQDLQALLSDPIEVTWNPNGRLWTPVERQLEVLDPTSLLLLQLEVLGDGQEMNFSSGDVPERGYTCKLVNTSSGEVIQAQTTWLKYCKYTS